MDELENKRRVQEGKFNRKEVAEDFLAEMGEIDEFAIAIRYKDEATGMYSSSGDITEVLGLFELAKLMALSMHVEEE